MTGPVDVVRGRAALHGIRPERPMGVRDAATLARGLTAYVATPYGDSEPLEVRRRRYEAALDVCGGLISAGVRAYCPIVHTHHLAMAGHRPPDGWYGHDLDMVGLFDVLVVAMLDGWDSSRGVALETERMESLGRPVLHVTPDG